MQPAADVNGAPRLLVGEEKVGRTFRSGEEETFSGRLHSSEGRHGRSRHLEGAIGEVSFSKELPGVMAFLILQPQDTKSPQTLVIKSPGININ